MRPKRRASRRWPSGLAKWSTAFPTNQSSGKSEVGNLSGFGTFTYESDGATDGHIQQHIGLTVDVGNIGWPAGEWIISGKANVTVSPAGQLSIQLDHAKADDICADLS